MRNLIKGKNLEVGLLIISILFLLSIIGWTVLVLDQVERTEDRVLNGNSYSLLIENVEPETVDYVTRLREVDHIWLLSAPELVTTSNGMDLNIRYISAPNFMEADIPLANGSYPSNETEVALGLNFATNFLPELSFGDEMTLLNDAGEESTYTITGLYYETGHGAMNAVSMKNRQSLELGRLFAHSSAENLNEISRDIQDETGQHVSYQTTHSDNNYVSIFDQTIAKSTFVILFISLTLLVLGCCLRLKMLMDVVVNPHKQLYLNLGYSPRRMKRKELYSALIVSVGIVLLSAAIVYVSFQMAGQALGSSLGMTNEWMMFYSMEHGPYIPFAWNSFLLFMIVVGLIVLICLSVNAIRNPFMKKTAPFFLVGSVTLAAVLIVPLIERLETTWTDPSLRYGEEWIDDGWDEEWEEYEGSTSFLEVHSVSEGQLQSFLQEARAANFDFLSFYRNHHLSYRIGESNYSTEGDIILLDDAEWDSLLEAFNWSEAVQLDDMNEGDALLLRSDEEQGSSLEVSDSFDVVTRNDFGEEGMFEQQAQIRAVATVESLTNFYSGSIVIMPRSFVSGWTVESDGTDQWNNGEMVTLYAINHDANELASYLQEKLGDEYPFVSMFYDGFNNWFAESEAALMNNAITFIVVVITPFVVFLSYAFYRLTRILFENRVRWLQLTLTLVLAGVIGLISWLITTRVVEEVTFVLLPLWLFIYLGIIGVIAAFIPRKKSQELH